MRGIVQLYFTGMHGEKCGSSKADVWAGCVTMMKALVGFSKVNQSTGEVNCRNDVQYKTFINSKQNIF